MRHPSTRPVLLLVGFLALPFLTACSGPTARASSASTVTPVQGAPGRRGPADRVQFVTRDIPNFWRAWDRAAGGDSAARVRAFEESYLRPASPGLRDWARLRLMDWRVVRARLAAAGWAPDTLDAWRRRPRGATERDSLERAIAPLVMHSAAEELVRAIDAYPRYYAAVRAPTLAVDTSSAVTGEIRRGLRRLGALVPEARFPDVYFLIGTLSTGGTVGPHGLLIGTEQYASGADTPRDGLPEWFQVVMRANSFDRLPGLVLHEAAHALQTPRDAKTLLEQALVEGGADFVAELAIGPWAAETPRQRYGRAHEREVWLDFKDEMATDSTLRTWMYNGMVPAPQNHGAIDIGYWVGYAIVKHYYDRATDKPAALREILALRDPERLLQESGYAAYAEALP